MKAKLKELTSRSNGWGNARRKEALRQYIIGWVNYFKLSKGKLVYLRPAEQSPNSVMLHKTQLFAENWGLYYSQQLYSCENQKQHKK